MNEKTRKRYLKTYEMKRARINAGGVEEGLCFTLGECVCDHATEDHKRGGCEAFVEFGEAVAKQCKCRARWEE